MSSHIPPNAQKMLNQKTGMTPEQIDTVLQLICLPENGETAWWKHYNYIEKLGDGRGFTVTIFGACSGTGDLLMIFDELASIRPDHPLLKYHGALKKCKGEHTDSIKGLLKDIPALGNDAAWQEAVWRVYVSLYWNFAMDFAAKRNECAKRPGPVFTTALAKGFFVDTAINHGADLPSFNKIINRMKAPDCAAPAEWLADFIKTRKVMLKSGFEHLDTSKTGDRCTLWRKLQKEGNEDIKRPIAAAEGYWGKSVVIA